MIIEKIVTFHKLRRIKADFREPYNSLPRNLQPQFRHSVMASQKWQTPQTFYNCLSGRHHMTKQTYREILKIFKKFDITISDK